MSNCLRCARWIFARTTVYADGSAVDSYRAPEGKGHCDLLGVETDASFGCNGYVEDVSASAHVVLTSKDGAPWQHWVMIDCPICAAKGEPPDAARCQCAGTGKVRQYDDGFIGDEKTRIHPTERELMGRGKPTCKTCSKEVEIAWVACPYCGGRLEAMSKTEVVNDPMGGTNATPEAMAKAAGDRQDAAAADVEAGQR